MSIAGLSTIANIELCQMHVVRLFKPVIRLKKALSPASVTLGALSNSSSSNAGNSARCPSAVSVRLSASSRSRLFNILQRDISSAVAVFLDK